jgi:dephospho-CoA kinase
VDRKQLGKIVFSSPESMSKLERIVWPHVKKKIEDSIESYRQQSVPQNKKPILVLEAAVLVDAGWQDLLDGLWIVHVPREVALNRLQENRGLSREDALTRINTQASRRGIGNLQEEVDKGVVSCVITNDGSPEDLKENLSKALGDENCWYVNDHS